MRQNKRPNYLSTELFTERRVINNRTNQPKAGKQAVNRKITKKEY
jgi:hypothetical protein